MHLALRQGQQVHRLQRRRKTRFRPLQQHDVAGLEPGRPKVLRQLESRPRHAQQVHAVQPIQIGLPHRLTHQRRVPPDHRLDHGDVVAGGVGGDRTIVANQFEPRPRDQIVERLLFALQQEDVVGPHDDVAARLRLALAVADQGHDAHLAAGHLAQLTEGRAIHRPVRWHAGFGQIGVGRQGGPQADRALTIARQQPVAERQKHQRHAGQGQADRGVVEHGERLAQDLLAHFGDDDVGRRADQGDHPARHGPERHRHQQARRRRSGPTGDLQGDRHHDRQGADVLGHHRQQGDGGGQDRNLAAFGLQPRHDPPQRPFDDARSGKGRRHHKRAGDDHHDIVVEAVEGRIHRNDADGQTRQQGADRDQVIAKPPPDEGDDGQADQAEGQTLFECHL